MLAYANSIFNNAAVFFLSHLLFLFSRIYCSIHQGTSILEACNQPCGGICSWIYLFFHHMRLLLQLLPLSVDEQSLGNKLRQIRYYLMYIFPFFQPFSNDCPANPMLLLILSYFYCNAFAISKFQNIGKCRIGKMRHFR